MLMHMRMLNDISRPSIVSNTEIRKKTSKHEHADKTTKVGARHTYSPSSLKPCLFKVGLIGPLEDCY